MGAMSPIGNTIDDIRLSLRQGVCGIGQNTRVDVSGCDVKVAGMVKDFDPTRYMSKKEARRMDLFCQYAFASARDAYQDSGLNADNIDGERLGVIYGSGIGGMQTIEDEHTKLVEKGMGRVSPFLVPMIITDIAAGVIAIEYGAKAINMSISTACATGANAIGEAFRVLRTGECDAIIAGSAEAPITLLALAGFDNMKAMSTRTDPMRSSTPFDLERDGFVIGEGAGCLILETLEHATARGAKIYGEILGYGATCDAYHITAPDPDGDGIARAMRNAIAMGGIAPSQVGYINAHGTGTPPNDVCETKAVKSVFGDDCAIPISSTKSATGHMLGAAGSFEAIVCLLAIHHGFVPATLGLSVPDPECDLDYVPNTPREAAVDYAISNSMGFGGHNASLLLGRYK